MEIRLVEKHSNGRIKNVEIYSKNQFCGLIDTILYSELNKLSLWKKITFNFSYTRNRILGKLFFMFEQRLKENKNKKKR